MDLIAQAVPFFLAAIVIELIVNLLALVAAAPVVLAMVHHSLNSMGDTWISQPSLAKGIYMASKVHVGHFEFGSDGAAAPVMKRAYALIALAMAMAIMLPTLRRHTRHRTGWAIGVGVALGVPALMWLATAKKRSMRSTICRMS